MRAFTEWVGADRKVTQTGSLTLSDARALVALLQTGDEMDPKIGDRALRTKSSTELPELNLIVEWAKAAGLVRVVKGRLLQVQKAAPLLKDPERLWETAALTPAALDVIRRSLGEAAPGEPIYQIRVMLQGSADPVLWRRLLVSPRIKIGRLHDFLVAAMGWEDCHLHLFTASGALYGRPSAEWNLNVVDEGPPPWCRPPTPI